MLFLLLHKGTLLQKKKGSGVFEEGQVDVVFWTWFYTGNAVDIEMHSWCASVRRFFQRRE